MLFTSFSRTVVLLLLIITTCSLCMAANFPLPLSDTEKKTILLAHNNARAFVVPAAQDMPNLVWDDDLAATAQKWVSSCKASSSSSFIDHNPNRSKGFSYYVGENIYAEVGPISHLYRPVFSWDSEKQYYNYTENSCKAGKVCEHYTQLVWAKTVKLGCGRGYCDNVKFKYTVVCNYGPGGNIVGEKPYEKVPSDPSPHPSGLPLPSPTPQTQTSFHSNTGNLKPKHNSGSSVVLNRVNLLLLLAVVLLNSF